MEKIGKYSKDTFSSTNTEQRKRKFPRVEKRREKIKNIIIEIAKRRFSIENFYTVKFESIAEEAEISRASLYSYFNSKEDIIYEIIKPVLEDWIVKYELLLKNSNELTHKQVIEKFIEIYLELWEHHETSVIITQNFFDLNLEKSKILGLYNKLIELKLKLLGKIEKEIRFPKEIASKILLKCTFSLIRILVDIPGGKDYFRESIKKLVFK